MKRLFTLGCVVAASLMSMSVVAQDDFSKGSDYYLIYLDSETEGDLSAVSNIKADYRLNEVDRTLYIWDGTYSAPAGSGANWNGSFEGYLNLRVENVGWSGLGFCAINGSKVDFTEVDGSYTFHVAMKSTATNTHLIDLVGGATLEGKVAVGTEPYVDAGVTYIPYADFPRDNKWHLVEIPMSEFFKAGLAYPEPAEGNYLVLLSGNNPGTVIALDAIFIYKKGGSGIDGATVDNNKLGVIVTKNVVVVQGTEKAIEVYNMNGQKVLTSDEPIFGADELQKGVYIVKSGTASAKFIIK